MIRVLEFTSFVNRYDFIDTIVQRADRARFQVGICVRSADSNIAEPDYRADTPRWVLGGTSRREVLHAIRQLTGILLRWRPHILHTHHYDEAVIGYLATRIARGTRLVVGRHYSDSIYRLPKGSKQRA